MVEGSNEDGGGRSEPLAEVLEVGGRRWRGEDLVDDGQEVVQGGDRRQAWCGGVAEGAAGGSEQQGGPDGLDGDAAGPEGGGEAAVCAADVAGGAGRMAVEVKDPVDIAGGPVSGHGVHGCAGRVLGRCWEAKASR